MNPRVLNDMLNAISEYVDEKQQQRIRKTERTEVDHIRRNLDLSQGA